MAAASSLKTEKYVSCHSPSSWAMCRSLPSPSTSTQSEHSESTIRVSKKKVMAFALFLAFALTSASPITLRNTYMTTHSIELSFNVVDSCMNFHMQHFSLQLISGMSCERARLAGSSFRFQVDWTAAQWPLSSTTCATFSINRSRIPHNRSRS